MNTPALCPGCRHFSGTKERLVACRLPHDHAQRLVPNHRRLEGRVRAVSSPDAAAGAGATATPAYASVVGRALALRLSMRSDHLIDLSHHYCTMFDERSDWTVGSTVHSDVTPSYWLLARDLSCDHLNRALSMAHASLSRSRSDAEDMSGSCAQCLLGLLPKDAVMYVCGFLPGSALACVAQTSKVRSTRLCSCCTVRTVHRWS